MPVENKKSMIKHVLDASAVLAVLNGERGEKKVIPILGESVISSVNLTEVAAKLLEAGMGEADARLAVSVLGIGEIADFTEDLAWDAARLRPLTRQYGLSLGDRALSGTGYPAQCSNRDCRQGMVKAKIM